MRRFASLRPSPSVRRRGLPTRRERVAPGRAAAPRRVAERYSFRGRGATGAFGPAARGRPRAGSGGRRRLGVRRHVSADADMVGCRRDDSGSTVASSRGYAVTGMKIADSFGGGAKDPSVVGDILTRKSPKSMTLVGVTR
jgi:hypothetical protein